MKLIIDGSPKEIADFVVAIQNQPGKNIGKITTTIPNSPMIIHECVKEWI